MSTRTPGSPAPKHKPDSGVHPIAPRRSFLVLVADPRFGKWLADEARPHGEATVAAAVASAIEHKPPAGHWTAALPDVRLTDGSGFTVLDALRRVDTDLPVLLFSDAAGRDLGNLAFEKRASLLSRPIPPGHVQMFLQSPLVRTHRREWPARRARTAHRSSRDAATLEASKRNKPPFRLTLASVPPPVERRSGRRRPSHAAGRR